ncbi:MAG: hypothetical protein ABIU54_08750, partial [Candidatus Eisenbacteria bacterium]
MAQRSWIDAAQLGCLNADGSLTLPFISDVLNRIYVGRYRQDGTIVPGWSPGSFQVAPGVSVQDIASAFPTPDGGNLFLWHAGFSSWDIWAQRLTSTGQVAPGWPTAGHEVAAGPGLQFLAIDPGAIADANDGWWLSYYSAPSGTESDAMLLRVDGLGNARAGWPVYGRSVTAAAGTQAQPTLCSDGADGIYVAWVDARTGVGVPDPEVQDYYDIYLQHFDSQGQKDPRWLSTGLPVCIWPGRQQAPRVISDRAGGVYVTWEISGPQGNTIHAQHILADGTVTAGWPPGGRRMFGYEGYAHLSQLCTDGQGGCFVAAEILQEDGTPNVLLQHVNAAGQFDGPWGALGFRVVPNGFFAIDWQEGPRMVPSLPGSIILCWTDQRSGGPEAYALRVGVNGVVAITTSLVAQSVSTELVALTWQAFDGTLAAATVERRTEDGSWIELATISPDGEGRLRFEDRGIEQGTRYAYRLSWQSGEGAQASAETWVQVPVLARFALKGATPNPSPRAALSVRYSLEAAPAPARIELYDLQGRCVSGHDLTSAGPGEHLLQVRDARLLDT